jgi:hypothetical protein
MTGHAFLARLPVLVICILAAGLLAAQEPARDPLDVSGTWLSDSSHTREYLMKGRELQLKWCAFAWPESEVDRRVQTTGAFFVRFDLSQMGADRYQQKIFNENGYVRTVELTGCSLGKDGRISCQSTTQGPFYMRRDGRYLMMDLKIRKSGMQCPKANEPPDEETWITPVRMTRQD